MTVTTGTKSDPRWATATPATPAVHAVWWLTLSSVVALFVANGALLPAAVAVAGIALLVIVLYRPRWLPTVWIVGTPTVFVFPNNVLHAILSALTVERLLFAVLVGLLGMRVLLRTTTVAPMLALERWMVAFLTVVILSLLSSIGEKSHAEVYRSLVLLVQGFVIPFATFTLARTIAWRREDLVALFRWFTAAGIYLAIAGAVQYFLAITILMPNYAIPDKMDRASGTFESPVEYGAVMMLLCLITLFHYARTKDAVGRAFLLAFLGLMFGAISMSKTRAVWTGGALAFAILYKHDRRVRPVILAGVGLAVAFTVYAELAAGRVEDVSPLYNRIALYATAANMFIHNPVLGVGFGADAFIQNRAAYFTSFGPVTAQWAAGVGPPHNELLNILVMTGLAGGIPYVLIWVATLKLTRRSTGVTDRATTFSDELALYLRAASVVVIVNALFADIIFYTYLVTLFFFLLGVLVVCRGEDESTALSARGRG